MNDSRPSIAETYADRAAYVAKAEAAAKELVSQRFLLPEDEQEPVDQAVALYDWAANPNRDVGSAR